MDLGSRGTVLYSVCSQNKGADQLHGPRSAARLYICEKQVFSQHNQITETCDRRNSHIFSIYQTVLFKFYPISVHLSY